MAFIYFSLRLHTHKFETPKNNIHFDLDFVLTLAGWTQRFDAATSVWWTLAYFLYRL